MIKNFIFDWSGTLCDDQKMTFDCTAETIKHFNGKPVTFDEYIRDFKIPVNSFYDIYCPNTPIKTIDQYFFKSYEQKISSLILFDAVKTILNLAHFENYNLYICTTIEQHLIEKILRHFGIHDYFKEIWGSSFNKKDILPTKINELNLNRDETIFVGDTVHDVETAQLAKIRAGAACYGYATPTSLTALLPDHIFNSAHDILNEICLQIGNERKPKPIATVGGLIFNKKGEALFVRTNKWSNKYGIPGGKIEINESMENAFIREIKEETNLDIKNIKFICIQDCISHPEFYIKKHFLLINYTADAINEDDVEINYESNDYQWRTLKDANNLDLNQPTAFLLNEVNK